MSNREILEKELELLENSRKMYYDTIKQMENKPNAKTLDIVKEEFKKVCERIIEINRVLTMATLESVDPIFIDNYEAAIPCTGDTEALAKYYSKKEQRYDEQYPKKENIKLQIDVLNEIKNADFLKANRFLVSFNVCSIPRISVSSVYFDNQKNELFVSFRESADFCAERYFEEFGSSVDTAKITYLNASLEPLYSVCFHKLTIKSVQQNCMAYNNDGVLETCVVFNFDYKDYMDNATTC